MESCIRRRREMPEVSWGDWEILDFDEAPEVLAMRYVWERCAVLALHNFGAEPRAVQLTARQAGDATLVDLLAAHDSHADARGRHTIELEPQGYRWFRAGGLYHGPSP
jgi:maltose alpha-D-glucosyltransferase/alpha-amylase